MYSINDDVLAKLKNIENNCGKAFFDSEIQNPNSPTFLKYTFIHHFIEDITFLNESSGNSNFFIRYANTIIRDILEQTIEFIYILHNPDLIDQYMGLSINLDEFNQEHSFVDGMSKFGKDRFIENRARVIRMAESIGQKDSLNNQLSLYDIYKVLSEQCHNSYFNSIIDDIYMATNGEKSVALTEIQLMYIYTIIFVVIDTFENI